MNIRNKKRRNIVKEDSIRRYSLGSHFATVRHWKANIFCKPLLFKKKLSISTSMVVRTLGR